MNANGVLSFSPRLRGTSYLGSVVQNESNPNGVASDPALRRRVGQRFNPFRVDGMGGTISQGRRSCVAPTLG